MQGIFTGQTVTGFARDAEGSRSRHDRHERNRVHGAYCGFGSSAGHHSGSGHLRDTDEVDFLSFYMAYAAFMTPGGALLDRYGSRRVRSIQVSELRFPVQDR